MSNIIPLFTKVESHKSILSTQVFVVPNLYVKYQEVYEVFWNATLCEPARNKIMEADPDDNRNPFPSEVIFSVDSPSSKQALSFYSRYHIEYVKVPELNESITKQQQTVDAMKSNEPVCCNEDEELQNSQCSSDEKTKCEEIKKEEADLQSIKDGRDGWLVNLNLEPERDSIVNWMTGFGSEGMHGDSEMKLDEDSEVELMKPDVESGLAPPDLIDSSVQLDTEYKKEKEKAKDEMRNSQRIQIAGKLYL